MQFITRYEPLYHARAWRRVKPEVFLYMFIFRLFLQNKIWNIYPYSGVFLLKQLFCSRLLDMR